MTPLAAFLARFAPRPAVPFVLIAIYVAMLLGLIVIGGTGGTDIAYVDVGRE